MIYGASGYTGQLIAEEAVRRGHRPLLAGRSQARLEQIARRLGLDWTVVDLNDERELMRAVADVDLVFHAAGPFIRTSAPMIRACLAGRTHYVDITGELAVFQHTFAQDAAAQEQGVALLSGAGFDVVPTDCLALHLVERQPDALTLSIAIAALAQASAGTTQTMLEMLPDGGRVRRNGALVAYPLGQGARRVRFSDRERLVVPAPWGDLETAYHSTGIPNITTYLALTPGTIRLMPWGAPLLQRLLAVQWLRRRIQQLVARRVQGPDETRRQNDRAYLWAQVTNARGEVVQAWQETAEPYQFTMLAGVRCVEHLLAGEFRGALTPASAFGADFVLETPGARRLDALP
jgi:short subunit dehydrogenase-like uncharacterized protein